MSNKKFSFELRAQNGNARTGIIKTTRGNVHTPAFMPVGTLGTVKGVFTDDLIETNSEIILANTYHLMLRPGEKILKKFNVFTSL